MGVSCKYYYSVVVVLTLNDGSATRSLLCDTRESALKMLSKERVSPLLLHREMHLSSRVFANGRGHVYVAEKSHDYCKWC